MCVKLLRRSHQVRSEAENTLTMISHDVEISIAGGGADVLDVGYLAQLSSYLPLNFITVSIFSWKGKNRAR